MNFSDKNIWKFFQIARGSSDSPNCFFKSTLFFPNKAVILEADAAEDKN
jgi:hypothetical protein